MKKANFEFDLFTAGVFVAVLVATILAYFTNNMEFLYYGILMLVFIVSIFAIHRKIHLSAGLFVALSLLILLHILGGNIYFGETRLYDMVWTFFRYDNIMHTYGSVIFTLIAYNMIRPFLDREIQHKPLRLAFLLVIITLGIGALNEIIEFSAVMIFASKGVGGYYNNMIDLIYNLVGGLIGAAILVYYHMIYVVKNEK